MTTDQAYEVLGIKRGFWCNMAAAVFAVLVVAPVTFVLADREDPVQITEQKIAGNLVPGGKARIEWEAVATKFCPGTARARITSSVGIVYEYELLQTVYRVGGSKERYAIEFTLPESITPGDARREVIVYYYCNRIQRWLDWPIYSKRDPVHFIVKEREK